jgi:hypothetical protein
MTAALLASAKDLLTQASADLDQMRAKFDELKAALDGMYFGPPIRKVAASWGDGVKDATSAIQMELDALAITGGVVVVPEGTFLVDGDPQKCIRVHSGQTLQIDGILAVKPSALERTYAVLVEGVKDVVVKGGGSIGGDRGFHTYTEGSTHEWGMGVAVYGSSNVRIEGLLILDCTGDGVVVGRESSDVVVENVISTDNRRQGLTIGRVSRLTVKGCEFIHTNGTKPQAGIDIEPDTAGSMLCEDVVIEDCRITDNAGCGIETNAITKNGVTPTLRRITIRNNELARNGFGLHAQRATDLTFDGNNAHDNRWHGCRLLNGTSTAKSIEGNTFGNNYTESLGLLTRNPAITDDGFIQNRDLKREDSAAACAAGVNTYR